MSSSAETVAAEHSSAQPGDVLSTRWLPGAPPKLMEKLEGWGYDKMPDLSGKTFIVTGGNSGIGREVSKHLALKGAHVVIASPDIERAEDAIAAMRSEIAAEAAKGAEGVAVGGHGNLEYKALDLAQLESIRTFARDIARRNAPLHGLVCNASVQLRAEETTADGMEQRWGANYVGHFLLIHLLLERLAASTRSRIVLLSSIQEELGWIPWDDPLALHAPSGSDYYAPSKLASLMLGLELARRLEGTGIDVFVAHPGIAQTDLFRKMTRRNFSAIMLDWLQSLFGQSAYRGGLPVAYAATEPSLQGKGGMFIGPRYLAQLCMQAFAFASLRPHNRDARSEHARYRLYEQTADALEEFLHVQLPNRLKGVPETKVRAGMKSPGSKAAAHEE